MFVLGLILILLSAGALVAVLATGTNDHAAMYGGSIELPTLVIFLAGAAALLLFIMGLELVRSGVKRANQNRLNKKRLRKLEKREGTREDGVAGETAPAATGDGTTATGAAPPPVRRAAPRRVHRGRRRPTGPTRPRRLPADPAPHRTAPRRDGSPGRPACRPPGGTRAHRWADHRAAHRGVHRPRPRL